MSMVFQVFFDAVGDLWTCEAYVPSTSSPPRLRSSLEHLGLNVNPMSSSLEAARPAGVAYYYRLGGV
jgi:hypothetical protein